MTVRRVRRLPPETLQHFLLDSPDPPNTLDWKTIFGNEHTVEVEVGFGKGLFLIGAAQACPHVNFLGIEIERKYQLYTANRLAKRALHNVRVAKADARELIRDSIATATVSAIHVFFPDPWWKQRHHKRRVFTPIFVEQCERVLQPGGRLHVISDVEEYSLLVSRLVEQHPRLTPLPAPAVSAPTHDLDYLTNFERKFRKEGRPIFRRIYQRD